MDLLLDGLQREEEIDRLTETIGTVLHRLLLLLLPSAVSKH